MREPFTYENNASWVRQVLVPDPLATEQLDHALESWTASGEGCSLLEWLVTGGTIDEEELLASLHAALGCTIVRRVDCRVSGVATPEAQLLRVHGFIVLDSPTGRKWAAGGPEAAPSLKPYLGPDAEDWEWVLLTPVRGEAGAWEGVMEARPDKEAYGEDLFLRQTIVSLWSEGASDIHFERAGGGLSLRAHQEGVMQEAGNWRGPEVRTRLRLLKNWAGLSTAAFTPPQDGRMELSHGGRIIRFRASHLCTVDGESLVLRVLGSENEIRSLAELGVPERLGAAIGDLAGNDPGMILCTGPTCSGKTTTVYGVLEMLRNRNLKILGIEDPVEYECPAAVQCAVEESKGWTFENAVRAFLRQDPDVIFIGEIRDRGSAMAACRAALTGHCVLSTLHARSVEAAIDRLAAWGLDPGSLAEGLRLIINQRLVPSEAGLRAEFTWLQPEPDEITERLALSRPRKPVPAWQARRP
ncbi:MAG: GspE/PulE family protein [Oceanipulchritudo sp.]